MTGNLTKMTQGSLNFHCTFSQLCRESRSLSDQEKPMPRLIAVLPVPSQVRSAKTVAPVFPRVVIYIIDKVDKLNL